MDDIIRISFVVTEQLFVDEICDPSLLRDYRAVVSGWNL